VDARCQVLKDMEDAIRAKWAGLAVVIQPFGSFPAGLSTFLSDIDISILSSGAGEESSGGEEDEDEGDVATERSRSRSMSKGSCCRHEERVTVVLDSEGEEVEGSGSDGNDDGGVSWSIDRGGADTADTPPDTPPDTPALTDHNHDHVEEEEGEDSDMDTAMNDCGGLDIHISSAPSSAGDQEGGAEGSRKRKRARGDSSSSDSGGGQLSRPSGSAASPSRETQLGRCSTPSLSPPLFLPSTGCSGTDQCVLCVMCAYVAV
jgi:hypothetical protein